MENFEMKMREVKSVDVYFVSFVFQMASEPYHGSDFVNSIWSQGRNANCWEWSHHWARKERYGTTTNCYANVWGFVIHVVLNQPVSYTFIWCHYVVLTASKLNRASRNGDLNSCIAEHYTVITVLIGTLLNALYTVMTTTNDSLYKAGLTT